MSQLDSNLLKRSMLYAIERKQLEERTVQLEYRVIAINAETGPKTPVEGFHRGVVRLHHGIVRLHHGIAGLHQGIVSVICGKVSVICGKATVI